MNPSNSEARPQKFEQRTAIAKQPHSWVLRYFSIIGVPRNAASVLANLHRFPCTADQSDGPCSHYLHSSVLNVPNYKSDSGFSDHHGTSQRKAARCDV